jgi:hypothetical protein
MLLYAAAIFLSAFLLFQVQPIIAKMVLPWFGGTSAVWTTCMLFFQLVLLAGYGYAHWLNNRRTRRVQAGVHSALLALSLAALPIVPNAAWKPEGTEEPTWLLLGLLAVTVGLPYFLLSTTSPLLQAWYTRANKGAMPYRLFALSNLASMLALLSYPPIVEPNLATRAQAQVWSAGYVAFALLCAALTWSGGRWSPFTATAVNPESDAAPPPRWSQRLLWTGLAACASTLLLAVTTFLTQDVAAIPFLWIVPLSVYLLSFIICFESPRFYWRPVYLTLLPMALVFAAYACWETRRDLPIVAVIIYTSAALFVFCMVCHGELASLKPHPRYLTGFYLMISLGGAIGGLFVGLAAPNLFSAYYEFPIGLAACAILTVVVLISRRIFGQGRWKQAALVVPLAAYLVFIGIVIRDYVHGYKLVTRNFYGRLAVFDDADPESELTACRYLVHGVIDHGAQALRPEYRRTPITYFCPGSGVGRALEARPEDLPRKIAILGLGCGTLASYGRPSDILRIYEINPLVVDIARKYFTFLKDTGARTQVVLGDGRLSLERESSQSFDVLVMDAFSGDSVPIHLITHEAFRTYFRHLKPDGILALNISNRYLNLAPVIERAAAAYGKIAVVFDYTPDDDDFLCYGCTWALVMDPSVRTRMPQLDGGRVLEANAGFREWTDDFSNIQRILK